MAFSLPVASIRDDGGGGDFLCCAMLKMIFGILIIIFISTYSTYASSLTHVYNINIQNIDII